MIDQQKLEAWKKSMEGFVINDIRFAVEHGKLETGLVLLTCAGIDCLGGFLAGKKSNSSTYKKFITKLFPDAYKPHIDNLWELRNKLVHDHIVYEAFILNRDPHEAQHHLQPCRYNQEKRILINRYTFASDFLTAWDKYLALVSSDQSTFDRMDKRASKHGYPQVVEFECD